MQKRTANGQHIVAVVVANGQSAVEFAGACEGFGIDPSAELGGRWYRFLVCSPEPSPITTEQGFSINVPHGLEVLRDADTIVVPASGRTTPPDPALLAGLRRANRRGARIVSVCTGAFTLAAAGLLDGRRATTHWRHAAEFPAPFPAVDVDPCVLYAEDVHISTSAVTP